MQTHVAEIVQRSRSLNEYSRFIGKIKANLADGLVLEEAIKQAIEYGIEHNLMKEFLEKNGAEVANMLLSGWNMDEALAVSKEEGFEDGVEYGEKLGLEKGEKLGEQKKQRELILALMLYNIIFYIAVMHYGVWLLFLTIRIRLKYGIIIVTKAYNMIIE